MTPDTHLDLKERRLWLEMKVFRQYQMLYGEALNRIRDLNYLIAINTRLLGERMLAEGDHEGHKLVVKFFNTYLRQTVNSRDVRTAYNVLNQYRLLAEHTLAAGETERVAQIAFYFKYYGQLAFNQGLPFILETVAYDLCTLNELAYRPRRCEQSVDARRLPRGRQRERRGARARGHPPGVTQSADQARDLLPSQRRRGLGSDGMRPT